MSRIVRRIEKEVGVPNLVETLAERMKPTDLQSLLLEVYRARVGRRVPRAVLADYSSNRFTRPSRCDPALLLEWDRVAFSSLPAGFRVIELSPVSPLGSVSCMATISQDWVLTTIRNLEVVADPTNILALECALQRQRIVKAEPNSTKPVHLACSHRVIRTQSYRSPSAVQHFRLFSLCSGGRNTQTVRFNVEAVVQHIRSYTQSLTTFLGPDIPLRATITQLSQDSHVEALFNPLLENLSREFGNLEVGLGKARAKKKEYYQELHFRIYATPRGRNEIELVDGGDSDWVHKLLNNARERLVTSGIGSERVCEILTTTQ